MHTPRWVRVLSRLSRQGRPRATTTSGFTATSNGSIRHRNSYICSAKPGILLHEPSSICADLAAIPPCDTCGVDHHFVACDKGELACLHVGRTAGFNKHGRVQGVADAGSFAGNAIARMRCSEENFRPGIAGIAEHGTSRRRDDDLATMLRVELDAPRQSPAEQADNCPTPRSVGRRLRPASPRSPDGVSASVTRKLTDWDSPIQEKEAV